MSRNPRASCIAQALILSASFLSLHAHAGFEIKTDPAVVPPKAEAVKVKPVLVATVAPSAPVAPRIAEQSQWDVKSSDITLRRALMRWAKQAGWQVSWEVKVDYPVRLEAIYVGGFDSAVEQYTAALRNSDYPLMACFYEGNRVVRILHFGEAKSCDARKDL